MATQYLIGESGAALPEGIVLAHTLHGEPANQFMPAHAAPHGGVEVIPVGEDGIAYAGDGYIPAPSAVDVEPDPEPEPEPAGVAREAERPAGRAKKCVAKDDTCMGWKINDSEFCAAHAGVFRKKEASVEPPTDA